VGACGPGTFLAEGDADGFHGGGKRRWEMGGREMKGSRIRHEPAQPGDTWTFPARHTNGNSRDWHGVMLGRWRRNEMPSMVANVSMEHAAGVWDWRERIGHHGACIRGRLRQGGGVSTKLVSQPVQGPVWIKLAPCAFCSGGWLWRNGEMEKCRKSWIRNEDCRAMRI
jgi:hypothetical protein